MSAKLFLWPSLQPDQKSCNRPVGKPVHEMAYISEPAHEPDNKPVGKPVDPFLYYPFTQKQGAVILYLIQSGGVGNRDQIAKETGISLATIKHSMRLAAQRGYLANLRTFCFGGRRGFVAELNQSLCGEYLGRFLPDLDGSVDAPLYGPVASSSSILKLLKTKKLTTSDRSRHKPVEQIEELLADPELGYWRNLGVSAKQVDSWSEEFQMPVNQVVQSLKHCRYEMVVLNKEEKKQISNPVNWFYKVMQKAGLYPKPTGYKSLGTIRAEQMDQAAKEAAEARERQAAAEKELAFHKILSDPEGGTYQSLLDDVSDFAKEVGGKALEAAMREAFETFMQQQQGLSDLLS